MSTLPFQRDRSRRDPALVVRFSGCIDSTTRLAQKQFNRWLDLDEAERTSSRLMEMLGFDYFTLLDLVTIARSRRHIERYYGLDETGRFPERLKPINPRPDVDRAGQFKSIRDINTEIRKLTLAAYAPLRCVLPHRQAAYDAKYSTKLRTGEGVFKQADREWRSESRRARTKVRAYVREFSNESACSWAWYEDRTSGPLSTWPKPRSSAIPLISLNSSGV